jgi:lipopolysaccharide transport system ATP-binding protein
MRLAFSVAAHLDPDILLVDEVLAVGDATFQKKCLGKMAEISRQGMTVFLVSHNMGAIQSLCKRAIFLKDGKICADGDAKETVLQYMSLGQQEEPIHAYSKDETKMIQIMKVSLLDHNKKPSAQLDILKPFSIEIEYDVRKPLEGVAIGVNILTAFNECIIGTCDFDSCRDKLKARALGVHKTWVTIPGKVLNSGVFSLIVGISVPQKYVYDRREVMQFELSDSGSFVLSSGEPRRNALLLLEIPWDTP